MVSRLTKSDLADIVGATTGATLAGKAILSSDSNYVSAAFSKLGTDILEAVPDSKIGYALMLGVAIHTSSVILKRGINTLLDRKSKKSLDWMNYDGPYIIHK